MNIDTLIIPPPPPNRRPKQHRLTDHSIAIQNGKILDTLPTQKARQKYQVSQTTDLPGQIIKGIRTLIT